MAKVFNVAAVCVPERHYMVDISERLAAIKVLVDAGNYFTMNRARQYGKTTTLRALGQYLREEYCVISMDFQTFDHDKFSNGKTFAIAFANVFLRLLKRSHAGESYDYRESVSRLQQFVDKPSDNFSLMELFECLNDICAASDKPIVLIIDEVDSASNQQVFLDFLAQLRAGYINRDIMPTFQSVILAGVYDVKNLRRKMRPEDAHRYNSPWNIAVDFDVDMSFSKKDIVNMIKAYEADYHTGMSVDKMAGLIYDYTSGYPFLVSKLCQLMDEVVSHMAAYEGRATAWTDEGFQAAVRILLSEKNTLFESLIAKLVDYPELNRMLRSMLFTGKKIMYNADESSIDMATMFGFIKNQHGTVAIANRIFETRLYNYYLSSAQMQDEAICKASLLDKHQFIIDGHLNMRRILEKFVMHFHDLYGDRETSFVEDEGRKYFLLYLRPIINGTGNYYIESQTRELRRTDVIIDYLGEQYIVEMKIWHGNAYNQRGENQLVDYLEDYHLTKGYMLSFNFNKKKQIGVHEIQLGDKTLIEAVV